MAQTINRRPRQRRGVIVVLTGFLLCVVFAFVSMSIDSVSSTAGSGVGVEVRSSISAAPAEDVPPPPPLQDAMDKARSEMPKIRYAMSDL